MQTVLLQGGALPTVPVYMSRGGLHEPAFLLLVFSPFGMQQAALPGTVYFVVSHLTALAALLPYSTIGCVSSRLLWPLHLPSLLSRPPTSLARTAAAATGLHRAPHTRPATATDTGCSRRPQPNRTAVRSCSLGVAGTDF